MRTNCIDYRGPKAPAICIDWAFHTHLPLYAGFCISESKSSGSVLRPHFSCWPLLARDVLLLYDKPHNCDWLSGQLPSLGPALPIRLGPHVFISSVPRADAWLASRPGDKESQALLPRESLTAWGLMVPYAPWEPRGATGLQIWHCYFSLPLTPSTHLSFLFSQWMFILGPQRSWGTDGEFLLHMADAVTRLSQLSLLQFDASPSLPPPEEGWWVVLKPSAKYSERAKVNPQLFSPLTT